MRGTWSSVLGSHWRREGCVPPVGLAGLEVGAAVALFVVHLCCWTEPPIAGS